MKKKIGCVLLALSLIAPLIYEKMMDGSFVVQRFLLFFLVLSFVSLNFVLNTKKLWNFIFNKRWFICIGVLLFTLMMEFNTSSLNCFDAYIQPNITNQGYKPIVNQLQSVRSDEWASATPLKLSQYELATPFSKHNNIVMGTDKLVTFYPQYANKSISMLSAPRLWGELLLNQAKGVTVDTMFEWIILFFVSFEFCYILTKEKKILSLVGAVAIAFSPAVVWWNAYNLPLYGEALVVLVYYFLKAKKNSHKLLIAALIGWVGACDVMTMYPAWLIPYSYIFFGIIIWLIITNFKKKDLKIIVMGVGLAVLVAALLIVPNYLENSEVFNLVNNTVYPGARFATGGNGSEYTLFNYIGSLFYWHRSLPNSSEAAQYIGLFPIPIILGIFYTIKNKLQKKKIDWLNVILIAIALIFTVNILFDIPLLSKITLLYFAPTSRLTIIVDYLCILIMLRYIATSEEVKLSKVRIIISTIIGIGMTYYTINIFNHNYDNYLSGKLLLAAAIIFSILFVLSILNNKKTNYIFLGVFAGATLISGVNINPLNIGVDVMYEKPIAKEVQSIVNKDKDSLWMTIGTAYVVNNYLAANGAKTITSTNYYPNYDLWKKLDNYKDYDDVINRYAYFMGNMTNDDTYFYLNQGDLVTLFINPNDVKTLGIDYLVSVYDISNYSNDDVSFIQLYFEDGMYIYQAIY